MATPKQRQRSERMFRAAFEEFSRCGFIQASVDEIALKAGVSKATLYKHFATKEALFLAVFDQVAEAAVNPPEIDPRTTPFEEGLKMGFRQLFTRVADTPEARFFFHCMTSDSPVLSEELRNKLSDRFIAASLGGMQKLLTAQRDGKIRPDLDLPIIHHALIGMVLQALRFWWSREKTLPVRKLADQLSGLILHGLAAPAPSQPDGTKSVPAMAPHPKPAAGKPASSKAASSKAGARAPSGASARRKPQVTRPKPKPQPAAKKRGTRP